MGAYHRHVVVTVACALLATGNVFAQTPRPGETAESARSPQTSSVRVAEGVSLEVVDWGGRGQTVVFLPGFGNTATSSISSLRSSLTNSASSVSRDGVSAHQPAPQLGTDSHNVGTICLRRSTRCG
jgi:hypothetical protein